jgi:hypothetical protein
LLNVQLVRYLLDGEEFAGTWFINHRIIYVWLGPKLGSAQGGGGGPAGLERPAAPVTIGFLAGSLLPLLSTCNLAHTFP